MARQTHLAPSAVPSFRSKRRRGGGHYSDASPPDNPADRRLSHMHNYVFITNIAESAGKAQNKRSTT
jgi:hypothetical protein